MKLINHIFKPIFKFFSPVVSTNSPLKGEVGGGLGRFREGLCLLLLFLTPLMASAFNLPAGNKTDSYITVDIDDIAVDSTLMTVDLSLDFSNVKMSRNVETVYTPMFVNGSDTVKMQSFAVTGRYRMYSNRRNSYLHPLTFYKGELADPENYNNIPGFKFLPVVNEPGTRQSGKGYYKVELTTSLQEWMREAVFTIDLETLGCGNCIKDNPNGIDYYALAQTDLVDKYETSNYMPEFLMITPVAEATKTREIAARAYIDFPVNQTVIYPNYRRNPTELAKIRATIDSIRTDKDITVTSLHISGTASPEGGYQNNVRLASGRTEALKNYVQGLYRFPAGFITTSFEPVDWQGLAEFLMGSPSDSIRMEQLANVPGGYHYGKRDYTIGEGGTKFQYRNFLENILPNRYEILAIVNSDIEPWARNNKIKTTYPDQYQWLLENVYPALRHSDYRIRFDIKSFTELSEILDVMRDSPTKLSVAELFTVASSEPVGSDLYNRAFDLAVTLYPEDTTANLNAAVNAMRRNDLIAAEYFLLRAGNTPEADYARATLKLLQGDKEGALEAYRALFQSPSDLVSKKAFEAFDGLQDKKVSSPQPFILLNP